MIRKTNHTLLGGILFSCAVMLLSANTTYAFTLNVINSTNVAADQPQRFISSVPYDNQVLDKSPEAVTITFAQPIRPDKSFLKVYDMFGTQLNDGTLASNGVNMSAQLPELSPGKYKVKWQARCKCSDDTDISDNFHFTVR